MKKIQLFFIVLSLLFVNVITAAEPENFIPTQSTAIFRFNAQMLMNTVMSQDPTGMSDHAEDFRKNLDEFKQITNIDPLKLLTGQVWGAAVASDALLYAKTGISEAEFAKLFTMAQTANKNADYKLSTTTIANKKAYAAAKNDGQNDRSIVVLYLAEDVLMIAPLNNQAALYAAASMQGGKNPLVAKLDRKSLAAAVIDMTKSGAPADLPQMDMLIAKLDLTGAKKQDLHLQSDMICRNEKAANQLAFQMQMMIPGLIGMMFGQDQALAEALASGLQIKSDKKVVHAEYKVTGEILKKAAIYAAEKSNKSGMIENEGIGPKKK